ncbi:hypothetical protein NQZ68_008097 [Dissostichus eleginoides]|nr:hypothetical protein NQZ68_008097 [Dissostichus eleginoides]
MSGALDKKLEDHRMTKNDANDSSETEARVTERELKQQGPSVAQQVASSSNQVEEGGSCCFEHTIDKTEQLIIPKSSRRATDDPRRTCCHRRIPVV